MKHFGNRIERTLDSHPTLLLALGAALTVGANMRWSIGILAWVAPIPFLRYLRLTRGWRSGALFVLAGILTWTLTTAKIVTDPLPLAFALLGVAFALFQVAGYLAWDGVRRVAPGRATLAFPAAMVLVEWLQHRFTGLTSWGAAAYTQVDDLPLLQVASVGGIAAVGFLVFWVAAALEAHLAARHSGQPAGGERQGLVLALGAAALAHIFGVVRLATPVEGDLVTVAAVGTTASFGPGNLPAADARAQTLDLLLEETARAAEGGTRLVVWNEAAALVLPDEEAGFVERVGAVARARGVHLVAAYIVPVSDSPLRFENKYRWFTPAGTVAQTYFKHHPAPGEPAVPGTGPLAPVITDFGLLGGALCYDYDVPALAREHGRLGVDLVALPSSDWRGIDPIHTQMAALRAVEEGVSVLRSTRFGLSAGIDPHGRLRAWQSSFESGDRVLRVSLPARGIRTVYAQTGDVVVGLAALFLALTTGGALVHRNEV
jgi:apolipoprotein N-acyltransferase